MADTDLPGTYDISLYQGDRYERTWELGDEDDADPPVFTARDFTGHTARAQYRPTFASPDSEKIDFTIEWVDQAAGILKVKMDGTSTASITGSGVWDLETYPDGSPELAETWVKGTVSISNQVTR